MALRSSIALRSALTTALVTLAFGAAILPVTTLAQADRYPNKPVRLLVPFPPGGSVDTVAWRLAPKGTPPAIIARLKEESAKWGRVIKERGMKRD